MKTMRIKFNIGQLANVNRINTKTKEMRKKRYRRRKKRLSKSHHWSSINTHHLIQMSLSLELQHHQGWWHSHIVRNQTRR